MLVAVAGAHGRIGRLLARRLSQRGEAVRGLIRSPDQREDLRGDGAEPVICDLESAGVEEVAATLTGAEAVVFTAGAGPGSGAERKLAMDYGGAVLLMEGARRAGVTRYVMVSAMGAQSPPAGEDVFEIYLRAKGRADRELQQSGLRYTIVRPGPLTDDPPTGRVRLGPRLPREPISRGDVAEVLAAVLAEPSTVGCTFELTAGEWTIERALGELLRS